jgi:hypothetical protein
VWRKKAEIAGIPLREFGTIRALDESLASLGPLDRIVFILDQYAGDGRGGLTGTAFLEKHGLGAGACLSTSEYDDRVIQDRVRALKARLIPKPRLAAARLLLRAGEGDA